MAGVRDGVARGEYFWVGGRDDMVRGGGAGGGGLQRLPNCNQGLGPFSIFCISLLTFSHTES